MCVCFFLFCFFFFGGGGGGGLNSFSKSVFFLLNTIPILTAVFVLFGTIYVDDNEVFDIIISFMGQRPRSYIYICTLKESV